MPLSTFGSMAPGRHTTSRRAGQHGEFNWASTDEGTNYFGRIGTNSTSFTSPMGQRVNANVKAAPRFQGFLRDLSTLGYQARDVSALAIRKKRGGSTMSIHSWGAALDVDPDDNPFQPGSQHPTTVFPEKVEKLAWKWGLAWGARFGDTMHFEAGAPYWWAEKLKSLQADGFLTEDEVYQIRKDNPILAPYLAAPPVPPPKLYTPPSTTEAVAGGTGILAAIQTLQDHEVWVGIAIFACVALVVGYLYWRRHQ